MRFILSGVLALTIGATVRDGRFLFVETVAP